MKFAFYVNVSSAPKTDGLSLEFEGRQHQEKSAILEIAVILQHQQFPNLLLLIGNNLRCFLQESSGRERPSIIGKSRSWLVSNKLIGWLLITAGLVKLMSPKYLSSWFVSISIWNTSTNMELTMLLCHMLFFTNIFNSLSSSYLQQDVNFPFLLLSRFFLFHGESFVKTRGRPKTLSINKCLTKHCKSSHKTSKVKLVI